MASSNELAVGLVNGVIPNSLAVKITVAVFLSVALYNAAELILLILLTFKRYHGLYFWSILVSTLVGVIPSSAGSFLHLFSVGPLAVSLTITTIGFYAMVPVQSLVLYSRLHLVFYNQRGLRMIRYTIIIVTIILLIPTTITTFGSAFIQSCPWNEAYQIVERLQVTGFCVQEFLISSLYIFEAIKLLRLHPTQGRRRQKIMYELVAFNVVVMLMDVALVVMEFLNIYYMQVSFKTLVYSVKLKLEFAVLGKLISLADHSQHEALGSGFSGYTT